MFFLIRLLCRKVSFYARTKHRQILCSNGRPWRETTLAQLALPRLNTEAVPHAQRRFVEYFAATIRNRGTRDAYAHAVAEFMAWSEQRVSTLSEVSPLIVAAYIELRTRQFSAPTVEKLQI